ncbi:sulfite exporter TauE/SafE family protein [Halovulum dunhuangense]|uniref:Probable membrane transporter protein n=1 Tax=Halovulum dunhuangense TaxID=1505036 RepID=A0A849L6C8_9RHOB|nr:sulfite exporter TauE/SafE family protein [Halovulum dunhuangense]NNU81702.1 sulfite exporter TauE/SafE family protein [Halovulum dunhuangense]
MIEALLPPDMGVGLFWGLMFASFVASFITVAFGIGGGGLLLAVMASLVPPAALIPVHGVIQVGSNMGRMLMMLREVHWPAAPAFLVGSVIGAALGGMLVVTFPPAFVQIGVGCFIVWSVFGRAPELMRRWGALTGAISSFLTMFFGATGLFVAAFTKSFKLERHAHVATHATLMTAQHLLKVVVFGILGFAFGPWLPFVVAMIVAGLFGTWTGRFALTRITNEWFLRMLNAVLLILAARLIWAGISDLVAAD